MKNVLLTAVVLSPPLDARGGAPYPSGALR